jgi:YD repeat-containing protein
MSGLEVTSISDTITVNGKKNLWIYQGGNRKWTIISPMGRTSYSWLDEKGHVLADSISGFSAIHYSYNDKGFLTQAQQGNRVTRFNYNAQGRLESVTDPMNRTATMAYDSVGRVLQQTLADGRMIDYSYDDNGNLTSLAPPGRPSHAFSHTPVNLTRGYYPPLLPDSTGNTYYFYNLDRQIVQTLFSDSSMIQVVYDTTGCHGVVGKPKIIFDRVWLSLNMTHQRQSNTMVSPTLIH